MKISISHIQKLDNSSTDVTTRTNALLSNNCSLKSTNLRKQLQSHVHLRGMRHRALLSCCHLSLCCVGPSFRYSVSLQQWDVGIRYNGSRVLAFSCLVLYRFRCHMSLDECNFKFWCARCISWRRELFYELYHIQKHCIHVYVHADTVSR